MSAARNAWLLWFQLRRREVESYSPGEQGDVLLDECVSRGWTCDDFDAWYECPNPALGGACPRELVDEGAGGVVWALVVGVDEPMGE